MASYPRFPAQMFTDTARLHARYILRLHREGGAPLRDLVELQTPWKAQMPVGEGALPWEEFLGRVLPLLGAGGTEDSRAEAAAAYAGPIFAAGRLAGDPSIHTWFGSFRYDRHPEREAVSLHIRNNSMPRSCFEDLGECFRHLRDLCAHARGCPFPVRTITCGSWLNSVPVFLKLFPPAYAAGLVPSPTDKISGWGWWGQFIDRTGRMHARRAEQLLATGQFPCIRSDGECSFDEFEAHVRRNA
jgi:hypothetical protein